MKHFSGPERLTFIAGSLLCISLSPFGKAAEANVRPVVNSTELLLSSSAQGYLGVGLTSVENDRVSALKLKDAHGAEILTVDQDAPAAKAGLKVHDVIVQMNGQRIDGVEQLRRMLRDTPPGRTVSLVAMRDGQAVNLNVQLADRAMIAKTIIGGLEDQNLPPGLPVDPAPQTQVLVLPHDHQNGFFGSLTRNRYAVGVELQPLPTGLAEYFGVHNGTGVLVGNVFPNTPAAVAGLKPADIIQKVNGQPIVTLSDWERAMRTFHGKTVQLTLIRDKKEQTLTMTAGEPKNSSQLDAPEIAGPDTQMLAELRDSLSGIDAEAMAQQLRSSMRNLDTEAVQKQAEQAAREFDMKDLQKVIEDSRKQIEQEAQELLQSLQVQQMD